MNLRLPALLLLLLPALARADWFSANLGLASDYQFRGLDQTNGIAPQGGLDYVHGSGLYAGAWATRNRSAGGGEFDLYGGYTRPLHLFGLLTATLDAGVTGYVYSGDRPAVLGGGSQDFAEVYAGLSAGPASFKASFAPDYAGRGAPGWYLEGVVRYPLFWDLKLRATLGYGGGAGVQRQTAPLSADGRGHTYLSYALRLSRDLPWWSLNAWAELAGTDLRLADSAMGGSDQPKFLVGLRRDFDL
jgi:uncharacterized protein (TIGR02001 family)